MGKVCTGKFIGENSMANLGFRNSWPTYRREKGDYVEPFIVGNPRSNWDGIEKKAQRLETAQAVAASNKAAKVKDRGGKPLYLVELDKLFVQLEKVQRSKDALLRHTAKTALVDLARVRSKLSTMATVGKKPVVSLSEDKVVKSDKKTPSQEAMAALTRREVALFRARWASLLS